MRNRSIVLAVGLLAFLVAGIAYYYGGHHNCIGSRSYRLEKRIRDLLYLETHEPVDYRDAARQYNYLLQRIRFDDGQRNYTDRYTKALARTKIKARALILFDEYGNGSNATVLASAWAMLHDASYQTNDEYGFLCFYWNKTQIDQEWINAKTR